MHKQNHGFTLIEMLVVIATFAIVIVGTINILATIVRNNAKTQILTSLKKEGGNALNLIARKLQAAQSITNEICADSLETPEKVGQIDFVVLNEDGTTTNYILSCEDAGANDENMGHLLLNSTSLINPSLNLRLSDCSILCYKKVDRYAVDFSFGLNAKTGEADLFSTSVTLRNYQQ